MKTKVELLRSQYKSQETRAELYLKNKNYQKIKSNSGRYKIEDSGVSLNISDYEYNNLQ
jgi:hypothetical protein